MKTMEGTSMKMMVDPPSGWKYGFPREYDSDRDGSLREFLVNSRYPIEDIEFALQWMRAWQVEN